MLIKAPNTISEHAQSQFPWTGLISLIGIRLVMRELHVPSRCTAIRRIAFFGLYKCQCREFSVRVVEPFGGQKAAHESKQDSSLLKHLTTAIQDLMIITMLVLYLFKCSTYVSSDEQ